MSEPVAIEVKDADGFAIGLVEFEGRRYPKFPDYKEIFPSLKDMKARPDDILIVTYPKSGTTWSRALVKELVRGNLDGQLELIGFLEMNKSDVLEKMESPRVLVTHITPDILSEDVSKKNVRIIFVVRNIKDAIVSCYHHVRARRVTHYDGTFTGFLGLMEDNVLSYGTFCDHLRSWETYFDQHPENPVLFLHYEDMKEDCLRELKRIRDFLELSRDDDFCQEVVKKYDFENMQSHHLKSDSVDKEWIVNRSTFFRKGEVGDWKNWFTVAQSERIDESFKTNMQGSKFKFRYEL